MTYISWSSDFTSFIFCSEKILVLLAKLNSGELRCPAIALTYTFHAFVCLFVRVSFCNFSLPLGVGGWLRFVIVVLPGLFY